MTLSIIQKRDLREILFEIIKKHFKDFDFFNSLEKNFHLLAKELEIEIVKKYHMWSRK